MGLDKTTVDSLKGVGPALVSKLSKIGVSSLQDVLFHLPFRYEDRTRVTPIAAVKPGDAVVLEGEVISCDIGFGRRRSLLAYLQDGSGRMGLRFSILPRLNRITSLQSRQYAVMEKFDVAPRDWKSIIPNIT